jgi:hypothetical protein
LEGMALRKEMDDEEMVGPEKEMLIPALGRRMEFQEEILEDVDLLGAATLAKLGGKVASEDELGADIVVDEPTAEFKDEGDR